MEDDFKLNLRNPRLHEPIENTDPHGEIDTQRSPFHQMTRSRRTMSAGSILMPKNLNTIPLSPTQTHHGESRGAYGILTNSLHKRSKHVSHDYMPNTATPTSHLPMPFLLKHDQLDERMNALKDSVALIATNVSVNTDNTTTNTRDIAATQETIASNQAAIDSNTKGIEANTRAIAVSVENITSRNDRISANTHAISVHQDDVSALKTVMNDCESTHEAYVTQTDDRLHALEDRLFGMSPVHASDIRKPGIFGELGWFRKHRDEWVVGLIVSNVVLFACLCSKCIAGSFRLKKK
eukprot:109499_1